MQLKRTISGPPSACHNLRANLIADRRIDLSWERPTFTGRDDFYYILEWFLQTSPTVEPVIVPRISTPGNGSNTIVNRSDVVSHTITGLHPQGEYLIVVTVRNGVSDLDDPENEHLRRCQLTVTTLQGIEYRSISRNCIACAMFECAVA